MRRRVPRKFLPGSTDRKVWDRESTSSSALCFSSADLLRIPGSEAAVSQSLSLGLSCRTWRPRSQLQETTKVASETDYYDLCVW